MRAGDPRLSHRHPGLWSARNASTSLGDGGRPVKSRYTRRSSVLFGASGAGRKPSRLEPRQDEIVDGIAAPGRILYLRQRRANGLYIRPMLWRIHGASGAVESGPGAPASIHCRMVAISFGASGGPPYGIMGRSCASRREIRRLFWLCPGTTTLPESLPLRMASKESSRRPFCCKFEPWQE